MENEKTGFLKKTKEKLGQLGRKGKILIAILLCLVLILLIGAGLVAGAIMDGGPFFSTLIQGEIRDYEKQAEKMEEEYVGTGLVPVDVISETGDDYDVYYMEQTSLNAPIVISIHGGGLITGDKSFNLYACEEICRRGCLVYAINYDLVPEVHVQDELQQVSSLIDQVMEDAHKRGYQSEEVSLLGDSAGGLLALYTAGIQCDQEMAEAWSVTPPATKIAALGCFSGLFYTTGSDEIGWFMSRHYYGNLYSSKPYASYLDPDYLAEHITLPPTYLVSSTGDYLLDDTSDFCKAMEAAGQDVQSEILDEKALTHDFPVMDPYANGSQQVFDHIVQFFKEK